MTPTNTQCSISEITVGQTMSAVRLESNRIAATILIDKGADIYKLVYQPRQMDVLWKTPWGINERSRGVASSFSSEAAWLESYPGGWQDIFPNGGDACFYKGVELNFHGEASMSAWNLLSSTENDDFAEIEIGVRLHRSPFRIHRTMRVEADKPVLTLAERITNEGREEMEYMWGFHPAFGAPFLNGACRIDTGARSFRADSTFDGTGNPLTVGKCYAWPMGERDGAITDMSIVPALDPDNPRFAQAYLSDFESGWYAITNTEFNFGMGLVWPTEIFPYAWLWQEMFASPGFPFYQNVYTMAIEPFSSIPGRGLLAAMEAGTHRTLTAGETVEAEIKAVFFESSRGVEYMDPDGTAILR